MANVALAGASYKMAMVTTIVTTRHSQMTACCILSGATIRFTGLDYLTKHDVVYGKCAIMVYLISQRHGLLLSERIV